MEANGGSKPGGEVPSLLPDVEVTNVASFDVTAPSPRSQPSPRPLPHPNTPTRPRAPSLVRVPRRGGEAVVPPLESPGFRSVQPVSVSLPASPSGFGAPTPVGGGGGGGGDSDVDLRRQAAANAAREPLHSPASQAKGGGNGVQFVQPERMMFLSQPIPGGQPVAYFIAMFLYASLAVRINFFRGFRFSLAWWAYTFPMTGAAIASIRYSTEVDNALTRVLCVALSAVATLVVTALFATTMIHAFVLHKLFPNDIAIAITDGQSMIPIKELLEMHADAADADADDEDIESAAAKPTAERS
uniref:Uncharacterized protein n=1 Tax=Oryza barthii TaxID=65489 RepID=A0A0D3G4L8_9ORYZ